MYKVFLAIILIVSQSAFAETEWVEFYHVPKTANPYDQAVYYAKLSSIQPVKLGAATYFLVETKHDIEIRKKSFYEQSAVLCSGEEIAPALSILKMGDYLPDGTLTISLDNGALKSISDFSLTKLDKNKPGPFSSLVNFVCGRVQ